jgi:hypothetical protein
MAIQPKVRPVRQIRNEIIVPVGRPVLLIRIDVAVHQSIVTMYALPNLQYQGSSKICNSVDSTKTVGLAGEGQDFSVIRSRTTSSST